MDHKSKLDHIALLLKTLQWLWSHSEWNPKSLSWPKKPPRSALLHHWSDLISPSSHPIPASYTGYVGFLSVPNMIPPHTLPLLVFILAIPFSLRYLPGLLPPFLQMPPQMSRYQKDLPNSPHKTISSTCHFYSLSYLPWFVFLLSSYCWHITCYLLNVYHLKVYVIYFVHCSTSSLRTIFGSQ